MTPKEQRPTADGDGAPGRIEAARRAAARGEWSEAARLLAEEPSLWRSDDASHRRLRDLLREPHRLSSDELSRVVRTTLGRSGHPEGGGVAKAFIVHGWDNELKWEAKNYLMALGLDCVVLHEQSSEGGTLIDKFERFASESDIAVILLSEADSGRGDAPLERPDAERRPRPNVLFEMGYFYALFGRKRVLLLKRGNVEINSDVFGIEYIDVSHGVEAAGEHLRRRLAPWLAAR